MREAAAAVAASASSSSPPPTGDDSLNHHRLRYATLLTRSTPHFTKLASSPITPTASSPSSHTAWLPLFFHFPPFFTKKKKKIFSYLLIQLFTIIFLKIQVSLINNYQGKEGGNNLKNDQTLPSKPPGQIIYIN